MMSFPDYSPWGKVQTSKQLCENVYQVSTAGHGGVMVLRTDVDKLLSPMAQQYGFVDGPWHCYEEDCDAPIVIRELLDKGLYTAPITAHFGPGEYSAAIDSSLRHSRLRYWELYQKSRSSIKIDLRAMTRPEQMYCYSQSQEISMKTGLIGYLRAELNADGNGFYNSFETFREGLKTPEFKIEFDSLINALRTDPQYEGIMQNRKALALYCTKHSDSRIHEDSKRFGVRADTEKYAYLLRLTPSKGEYNLYCYCYYKEWLDQHLENAQRGIRFIDPNYKELFRISDGDRILITLKNGEHQERVCRYIDDSHMELGDGGSSRLFHICELAELRHRNEWQSIVPLRSSLPESCYSNLLDTGAVVILKRGKTGYYPADIPFTDRESAKALVEKYNERLGISKPQFEAMKAGSMFGFHTPAANPKNYDAQGMPIRPKAKDRGDAR